ncbi:VMA21-like domain-containing protein [Drepanopeziza brunnea f. sp. 'multigermtubi' MB_m1]|uniref:VMA21-like domain-containing protein n=1 Tax=Marssonina brunnea f. sp. multigermtubi (strain MB_m1) TaxID=1072389 RepID=K1XEK9_MARBU|nr:VMA21-like domain-containing protein [Drepanopeziza brunnea f. sp. 'multigermtubi' MB_m1]EKD19323.1 VMA21-like domain-containing protein [Drepanopeziza brunnea f. sp. 'multigermtubi' MB_m1]
MATRRHVPGEKTSLEKHLSQPLGEKSIITPAVPPHVIFKLLGFTLAMVVVPIGSYFLTLNTVFGGTEEERGDEDVNSKLTENPNTAGNSTWAGATAAIIANAVLIGYVIVAFNEDQSEALRDDKKKVEVVEKESKKGR